MRIFLDLDGVLVDFREGVSRAHGVSIPEGLVSPESMCMSKRLFEEPCHHESFWRELKWMPDGRAILALAEWTGDVYFLTDPTFSDQSYLGKIQWVELNCPRYKKRTILCAQKELLAGNGVLVDDFDENVNAFNLAGGAAILMPRPWNSRAGKTFDYEALWRNF